jgi:large-conductance mechanosensitive channel
MLALGFNYTHKSVTKMVSIAMKDVKKCSQSSLTEGGISQSCDDDCGSCDNSINHATLSSKTNLKLSCFTDQKVTNSVKSAIAQATKQQAKATSGGLSMPSASVTANISTSSTNLGTAISNTLVSDCLSRASNILGVTQIAKSDGGACTNSISNLTMDQVVNDMSKCVLKSLTVNKNTTAILQKVNQKAQSTVRNILSWQALIALAIIIAIAAAVSLIIRSMLKGNKQKQRALVQQQQMQARMQAQARQRGGMPAGTTRASMPGPATRTSMTRASMPRILTAPAAAGMPVRMPPTGMPPTGMPPTGMPTGMPPTGMPTAPTMGQ